MNSENLELYIKKNTYAIKHLFLALKEYQKIIDHNKAKIKKIEDSKTILSNMFIYNDQWKPNANYHFAQYSKRLEHLEKEKRLIKDNTDKDILIAMNEIGATRESMSSLAGSVLQIVKQILSIKYKSKPNSLQFRKIGQQSIIEVIWEGRNHAMHWDDKKPRKKVTEMLEGLEQDFDVNIAPKSNNSLLILEILGWNSHDFVIRDLIELVK